MTMDKILDSQPPEEKYDLHSDYVDIIGIKSDPKKLEGFQLETNSGNLIVPPEMKESDSTLLFKVN